VRSRLNFQATYRMKQRRSVRSKESKLKRLYKSLSCTGSCRSLFDYSPLLGHALVLGRSATIMSESSSDLPRLHVECAELYGTRSIIFEIIINEKPLSELVIWVNHGPKILLGVSLRSLWVSHRPIIRFGVSLRSLCSRHLRGFIYNNFLFLLL
jgi:hypothetical protein